MDFDQQGEYTSNMSAENDGLIVLEQNGMLSARKTKAERAGEPMDKGLFAPSPEVP